MKSIANPNNLEPCITYVPIEEPINNNNVIPGATIDNAVAMLKEVLAQITPFIPNITPDEAWHAKNITDKTMETVIKAENFAEQNPKTISPVINIGEWAGELQAIVDINQLKNLSAKLAADINRYELRMEIDAMENFTSYYRCIKTLIQEGYTEAIPIYDELKKMYSSYFHPKRKKEKPTNESETKMAISATIKDARNAVANNKHLLKDKIILELDSSDEN